MPALQVLQAYGQRRIEELQAQLDMCPHVTGRTRKVLEDYLIQEGIYSLAEVSENTFCDYREFVFSFHQFSKAQMTHFFPAIETVVFYYWLPEYGDLINEVEEYGAIQRPIRNKICCYLMVNGIHHRSEIDYQLRKQFEAYMIRTEFGKIVEYTKVLDWLKLYSIRKNNEHNPFRRFRLSFKEEVVYLGYHPDYETAYNFYYLRDKTELVFDFSLDAPITMKRQIFNMLNYALEKEYNRKNRRELYLVPLRKLYLYCVDKGIKDIELLELEDIEGFRQSMDGKVGTKTDIYMQIVDNIRKFLFLNAADTNWQANVWYMERFHFKGERMNPAEPVESIHFYLVKDLKNRQLLKSYMRYCIGIGGRAINTIRGEYYNIYKFLMYCDEKEWRVVEITADNFNSYVQELDSLDIQAATFNQKIEDVYRFYQFLVAKQHIENIPFNVEYYLKKTILAHHDRAVPEETQQKFLAHLKYFPEHLRLMYLHLWCIGLRVNEVCTLKGDAYYWKGQDAWIKVYQYKMKTEKVVPIPKELYILMTEYIQKNGIAPDEFIFKGTKGRAYPVGTFCKQMKELCLEYDITCGDYIFRSHDYRHMVGTKLYDDGTSIQGIRDYLGHKEEDMTKQYIDFVPKKIDKAGEEYFRNNASLGAGLLKKRRENKNGK